MDGKAFAPASWLLLVLDHPADPPRRNERAGDDRDPDDATVGRRDGEGERDQNAEARDQPATRFAPGPSDQRARFLPRYSANAQSPAATIR